MYTKGSIFFGRIPLLFTTFWGDLGWGRYKLPRYYISPNQKPLEHQPQPPLEHQVTEWVPACRLGKRQPWKGRCAWRIIPGLGSVVRFTTIYKPFSWPWMEGVHNLLLGDLWSQCVYKPLTSHVLILQVVIVTWVQKNQHSIHNWHESGRIAWVIGILSMAYLESLYYCVYSTSSTRTSRGRKFPKGKETI